jgi:hypothetical protein
MVTTEKYLVRDVFTPAKPARLTFVEREHLNTKLVNALQTPGKQIVVYGHTGSGKSTLLANKLQQLYEDHITTRCVSNLTFEHLVLDAFDQLDRYYVETFDKKYKAEGGGSVQAEYLGLKAEVKATREEQAGMSVKRFVPPQLTPRALAKLIGSVHACWVLEDFHKLPTSEKTKLSQVMKVFMDMADEFPSVKIIALGAVGTAREVVAYDPEMRNRVAEIEVPLMTDSELKRIPEYGEKLLNIVLPAAVKNGIVRYANGMASICHNLCLNICNAAGIVETQQQVVEVGDGELKSAVEQYLAEASDTLKSAFDRAFRIKKAGKYDNCRIIVEALAQLPQEGATYAELFGKIKQQHKEYPGGSLTHYLRQLQTEDRGALIRVDNASGKFSFADPIYRAFAMASIKKGTPLSFGSPSFPLKFGAGGGVTTSALVKLLQEHLVNRLTELENDERSREGN